MTGPPKYDICISTPGRICLFGEHQDYLHLPVIACAISLRIRIEASLRTDRLIRLDLPDLGSSVEISLGESPGYLLERDYFRSGMKVLRDEGYEFSSGFNASVHSTIPVNAGTSSSSALVVSWINLLSRLSRTARVLQPEEIARLAHRAEVVEFQEPGGSMDHLTTAMGRILSLAFHPSLSFERLSPPLGPFVLGDSHQPKDTKAVLARSKERSIAVMKRLQRDNPALSYHSLTPEDIISAGNDITTDERLLLQGNLRNREITLDALALMRSKGFDGRRFGELLTEHHSILRDTLGVSTPKIDGMLDAAMTAGAYGGKINGSGGGGCMFAYAPENPDRVAEAVKMSGGTPYIVTVDEGTRRDP